MTDVEKVMEVLRQVEWATLPLWWGVRGHRSFCPCCREWKGDSHADDCGLAALLSEREKEKVPVEHFTREELAELCTRARALAEVQGTNPHWVNAYWELANAADRLDAMESRSGIPKGVRVWE